MKLPKLHWLDVLLVFVPAAAILHGVHAPPIWVFSCSCLAIVPLAGWMGRATEGLSARLGAGVGGLLNATFGNAAELIIAISGLRAGLIDVVKASITGSILGNILLVIGASMLTGGIRYKVQRFNRTAVGLSGTLMALSAIALLVPALFHMVSGASQKAEMDLSMEISVVLLVTYVLSLIFSLKTHRDFFTGEEGHDEGHGQAEMGWKTSAVALVAATALVAWMSEMLVGSVEEASHALGLTEVFVGVVVVAIIGNAAEHSTAILVALKNRMDLALHIGIGSSIQIALLVAPLLVLLGRAMGQPMDLLFTSFEVVTVGLSALILNMITSDGESNWMEGVLLLAVYSIFGIAFFCMPG